MSRPALPDLYARHGAQPAPYNGAPSAGKCPHCKRPANLLFETRRYLRRRKNGTEYEARSYRCARRLKSNHQ